MTFMDSEPTLGSFSLFVRKKIHIGQGILLSSVKDMFMRIFRRSVSRSSIVDPTFHDDEV